MGLLLGKVHEHDKHGLDKPDYYYRGLQKEIGGSLKA